MNKYKVGDKVALIGEITNVEYNEKTGNCHYDVDLPNENDGIYYVCEDKLQSYESFVEQHCKQTYEDGLADAWEAARKIVCGKPAGGLPEANIDAIFGRGWHVESILAEYTAQEAIAKIKEWEDSNEIRRGDEVESTNPESCHFKHNGIVLQTGKTTGKARVMWDTNKVERVGKSNLKKTGRNFADKLDALLGEIGRE